MGIKTYRPVPPGQRHKTSLDFSEITKTRPEKSLTRIISKSGGRNHRGLIASRHRGGGRHGHGLRFLDQ